MWLIAIACNGCSEPLAWLESPHDGDELRSAGRALKTAAECHGWERVDAPDGQEWFCPTCRRARDGANLMPETRREAATCPRK